MSSLSGLNDLNKATNIASNLISQISNSKAGGIAGAAAGGSISGAISAAATTAQNSFSSLTSTGSLAAAAASSATANQAAQIFGNSPADFVASKVDTSQGFSFANDLTGAINNALVQAVPSFGAVSVDFASAEGRLGVLAAKLDETLNANLDTGIIPAIDDKTEELKELAKPLQVTALDITPASITSEQTAQLRTIAQRNLERAKGIGLA